MLPGRGSMQGCRHTLTTGARQLVVQEAAVTMWSLAALYRCCRRGWAAGQQLRTL